MGVDTPSRAVIRYHGGKWRLAPWILSYFPQHDVYVEPFGGGASVLFQKPRSYAEVYNDLDGELVNLFRVLRDQGEELQRRIALTPYAREEFDLSYQLTEDPMEQARRTLMRSHAAFGTTLTRMQRNGEPMRSGFRTYTRRDRGSTPASDWSRLPEMFVGAIARLKGVLIERKDAVEVMLAHDGPGTLHYVDPPYVHSTRALTGGCGPRGYRHEMTDEDHRALAQVLRSLKGKVILSGYHSPLYDELYGDWTRVEKDALADGARDRVEVLWMRNLETGMLL